MPSRRNRKTCAGRARKRGRLFPGSARRLPARTFNRWPWSPDQGMRWRVTRLLPLRPASPEEGKQRPGCSRRCLGRCPRRRRGMALRSGRCRPACSKREAAPLRLRPFHQSGAPPFLPRQSAPALCSRRPVPAAGSPAGRSTVGLSSTHTEGGITWTYTDGRFTSTKTGIRFIPRSLRRRPRRQPPGDPEGRAHPPRQPQAADRRSCPPRRLRTVWTRRWR